jgi:hypothetical protein
VHSHNFEGQSRLLYVLNATATLSPSLVACLQVLTTDHPIYPEPRLAVPRELIHEFSCELWLVCLVLPVIIDL